ncbi:ecotropic viral integration site 5 ortholog [Antennarius striatus]|uniref:ecotropic viral integration site 5 ortholog n=1 Tax=Antennarius striatus TaxID=241820 RepID=UPI0035AE8629
MLKSSTSTQKSLGKEDSSEADSESEAGLEPETDRFGFIVTDGCTTRSVGPPPELVRQREAKWINIIVQWDRIVMKNTSKVKVQCQKGIPASLRAKCWPLLCGAADEMKRNRNIYQYLDSQPALESWVDVIERDLDRQFPFHEMFLSKDGHGQRSLFRVLKAYTQYQPDKGYCQAQGPVAAVLLMNMPAEEAFWCLVQISEHYLPGYYSPLLEGILFDAAMLTWVLKKTCPAAYKHLQRHDVEPLMFATDWLMCLFTRHLPFNTLLRVWDLFFCYGVRVLLQVAVVLVCRVLGRAEQRKRCQGQMETLEKLRAVRDQVHDEDDSFIAEVCSVPLSPRDLEKQMEKELENWRRSSPSSTFNPRDRCQGFQMVWARARQKEEEQDRKERQKGNLSILLPRSASTLSLSPHVIHESSRKEGKSYPNEGLMEAKDAMRRSTESNYEGVKGVQEERKVSEEHKTEAEIKLRQQTQHKETKQMVRNIQTKNVGQVITVKEQNEHVGPRITGNKESQVKETKEKHLEAEPPRGSSKDQSAEHTTQHTQLNSHNQPQVMDQRSVKCHENEANDQCEATVNQKVGSELSPAVEESQIETQKYVNVDPHTGQQMQIATDTSLEGECHRHEFLPEADKRGESHTITVTESNKMEADRERKVSEKTLTLFSTVCIRPKDGIDLVADTPTEEEKPSSGEEVKKSNEVIAQRSEGERDTAASETTCDIKESFVSSEADNDLTKTEEKPKQSPMTEETFTSIAPAQKETNLPKGEQMNFTSGPVISLEEMNTSDEQAPQQPDIHVTVEMEESTEPFQEITIKEISTEKTHSNTKRNPQVQDRESHFFKEKTAQSNNCLTQTAVHHCSRPSRDICIRKSSSYCGHTNGRRLSEDLFIMPQKTGQSQSIPNQPVAEQTKSQSNTRAKNPTKTKPDLTRSLEFSLSLSEIGGRKRTEVEHKSSDPLNRFGLFRRVRGDQVKKTKTRAIKMQVPKILIQDFSDETVRETALMEEVEVKLSSRERRRLRREQDRKEKEEEGLRKKRAKEMEKARKKERKRLQTTEKSYEMQKEKGTGDETHPAKTGSQTHRYSASYADTYF